MRLNQYFITDDSSIKVEGFNNVSFNEFTIYSHSNLSINIEESTYSKIALLGFIINPFKPELSNKSIAEELSTLTSKDDILSYIEKCSGRFVLFITNKTETFLVNDFMALRQINYIFKNKFSYISSNEKLLLDTLNLNPKISRHKKALSTNPVFLNVQEHWFLDSTNWDSRIQSVLPNHLLDLKLKKTKRFLNYNIEKTNYSEALKQSTTLLKQSLLAISKRYNVIFPITSGYDSRLMLASALSMNIKMKNFIFNRKGTYIKRDVETAKILAKKYNLDFKIITPKNLQQDFITNFKTQFLVPRILQKTQNIQWFKNQQNTKSAINIVGIGGGLLKAFYNNDFNNVSKIIKEVGVDNNKENNHAITEWVESAEPYAKLNNISLSDLFFLEIRTGLWASKTALELDFAEIEEFSPFNNRYFVYNLLKNTSAQERKSLKFYNDLLEETYKGISEIPLNPKTWRDIVKKAIFYDAYKKWIHKIKY